MFELHDLGKIRKKKQGGKTMRHETINPKNGTDEIKEIFVDGLQRDLSTEEESLLSGWTRTFDKTERATIINMMKELLNKHKRHD
jgi:hypothetical protein